MSSEILCYCGGDSYIHFVGSEKCFREIVEIPPMKNSDGTWTVEDEVGITDHILFEQWLYRQHKNGTWSRPKEIPVIEFYEDD